jgi:cell division protease FtsH
MTEKEKELTAYHEAGHALVGLNVPDHDPLHKVTIIPRGRALGVTMSLPERDRFGYSKREMESRLASLFGGRLAEEIIFGADNVTTGASSDIQQATATARRMVTEFGMSEKLGRVRYGDNEQELFLGHSVTQTRGVSEATAQLIDSEVRRLIEEAETTARTILIDHIDELHRLAQALLEYETLSGDEIRGLLRGEPIVRKDSDDTPVTPAANVPPPRSTSGRRPSVPNAGRPTTLEPEPQA